MQFNDNSIFWDAWLFFLFYILMHLCLFVFLNIKKKDLVFF